MMGTMVTGCMTQTSPGRLVHYLIMAVCVAHGQLESFITVIHV
jgi:hypothetical protein